MNWLSQTIAVTGVTLRSIGQRLGSSTVAVIGIAGVVIVFTAVLSIAEGFRAAMTDAGDPLRVIVLRSGSDTEMTSGLSGDDAKLIMEAPGIARGPDGPIASPELFVIVGHPLKRTGADANVPLRGLSAAALLARPEVKIAEGRMFTPGTSEIVVGRAASRQFSGLNVGSTVRWGEGSWQVVGIFEAGGSVAESELWCDARVLQPAYRRGNSYQSVLLRLPSADAYPDGEGRTHHRSAAERHRDPRAGLLRPAVDRAADDRPDDRVRHRRADGARGDIRRGQHHVFGGLVPDPRDRDAAGAGIRQEPGGDLGAHRGVAAEPDRRGDRWRAGLARL